MFARTPRLMLRPGWAEDAPALARAIGDAATARDMACIPLPYGQEDAERFLAQPQGTLPSLLVFLRGRDGPTLIGGVGLHARGDAEGAPELGYWIGARHRGHGFATEAAAAMVRLAHGSLGLRRLVAGHYLGDPASGRVLRKLGFRPTGAVRALHSGACAPAAPYALFERKAEDAGMENGQRATPLAA